MSKIKIHNIKNITSNPEKKVPKPERPLKKSLISVFIVWMLTILSPFLYLKR